MTHAESEHKELRSILDEISLVVDDEEEFIAPVELLKEKVTPHVKEEETSLFAMFKINWNSQCPLSSLSTERTVSG